MRATTLITLALPLLTGGALARGPTDPKPPRPTTTTTPTPTTAPADDPVAVYNLVQQPPPAPVRGILPSQEVLDAVGDHFTAKDTFYIDPAQLDDFYYHFGLMFNNITQSPRLELFEVYTSPQRAVLAGGAASAADQAVVIQFVEDW